MSGAQLDVLTPLTSISCSWNSTSNLPSLYASWRLMHISFTQYTCDSWKSCDQSHFILFILIPALTYTTALFDYRVCCIWKGFRELHWWSLPSMISINYDVMKTVIRIMHSRKIFQTMPTFFLAYRTLSERNSSVWMLVISWHLNKT